VIDISVPAMKITLAFLFMAFVAAQSYVVRSLTIYPIADSILRNDYPSTNYGNITTSYVFQDWGASDNTPTGVFYDLVTMFNVSVVPGPIINASVYYTQLNRVQDEVLG
jgi:hypothetical protein